MASLLTRIVESLVAVLPRGKSLPERQWRQRHLFITGLLVAHAPALFVFALIQGFAITHAATETLVPLGGALAATVLRGRIARSCAGSVGLMATSAMVVHLSGGAIEAHFHFFVMVPVVALYEDWPPFGLAIGSVLLHHGLLGATAPSAVYSHPAAISSPWQWAAVHAGFIAGACAASIANWRLHERGREAERHLAAQMSYQARHDALTGLCNRRELEHRISQSLNGTGAGVSHVFVLLDLDRFKLVNDACGHLAGDEVLRTVGSLLLDGVGPYDVVARLGGDEFALLLTGCDEPDGRRIVDDLRRRIEAMAFTWDGRSWPLSVSAGIVAVDGSVRDLEQLLRAADVALYAAKDAGRNRVHSYEAGDDRRTERRTDLQTVTVLREALRTGGLELYFQPIAAIGSGTREGRHGELLLRLRVGGQLHAPGSFLPAAERYDLMPAIDRWVVREAISTLAAAYRDRPAGNDLYAVNLSGATLSDLAFPQFVIDELRVAGLQPSLLCFEVTETVAISNLVPARHAIQRLRAAGCRFALDDFGVGMSSFAYLKNLPVDFLKVDGSFVRGIVDSDADRAVVDAVNRVAHSLGMLTIAEYVETPEILANLRGLGVDYAQGYEICRPGPLAEHLAPGFVPAQRGVPHAAAQPA